MIRQHVGTKHLSSIGMDLIIGIAMRLNMNWTEKEKDIIARYLLDRGKYYVTRLNASSVDRVTKRIDMELIELGKEDVAEELYQYYEQEWE